MVIYIIRPDNNVMDNVHKHLTSLNLNKSWDVTIEPHKAKRSKQQGAYVHVLFRLISDHTGYTEQEVKYRMKDALNFWETFTRKDGTIKETIKSTADMTVDELNLLIDECLTVCLKLNIKVPDSRYYGYD